MVIIIWLAILVVLAVITGTIRIWYLREKKTFPKKGVLRQASDCRHPEEYTCVKCGDCGRRFIDKDFFS